MTTFGTETISLNELWERWLEHSPSLAEQHPFVTPSGHHVRLLTPVRLGFEGSDPIVGWEYLLAPEDDMTAGERVAVRPDATITLRVEVELPDEVLAIGSYRTNAELIAACAQLGYLTPESKTWDATYRNGKFWTLWQPKELVRTDLDPEFSLDYEGGLDATRTTWTPNFWDVVVIDGPYKLNGTPDQGGPASSDESYGVHTPSTWQERHQLLADMLAEGHRVLKPRGYLLFKCMAQVVSGKVRWQPMIFANQAEALGMELVDQLHLVGHRAQPKGRRQVHARQNYSTLLVLQKGRK